jgi:tripartite-type tricarboxylate transporter receptor subunit TctC
MGGEISLAAEQRIPLRSGAGYTVLPFITPRALMSMHKVGAAMLASLAVVAGVATASAQSFPSRPITMIVPFAAGGPTDVIARVVGERMGQSLGQSVVVENVTGAGGTIAAGRVARAAPDGYTVDLATWSTHVVTPVIYQLQYDVFRDFAPVLWMTQTPLVLVSRKNIPAGDLQELLGWLKGNANAVLLGSAGGTDQVAGYLLQLKTGAKIQIVPYRGLAPAMQDLMAGRIDLLFDQPSDAIPQIKSGAIKGYAVTAASRAAVMPDIPTVDEAGLPGLHISPWHSLWVPKGTPPAAIAKLNAAAMEALADPAVRKRLSDIGQEIVPRERQTPEALAAYYKSETDQWWPIIKAAGIKAE